MLSLKIHADTYGRIKYTGWKTYFKYRSDVASEVGDSFKISGGKQVKNVLACMFVGRFFSAVYNFNGN